MRLDVVCCDGVGMSTWPFSEEVNTANGFAMNVRRKNRSSVVFGETATESCDHLAKDGLIHYVDKVSVSWAILTILLLFLKTCLFNILILGTSTKMKNFVIFVFPGHDASPNQYERKCCEIHWSKWFRNCSFRTVRLR